MAERTTMIARRVSQLFCVILLLFTAQKSFAINLEERNYFASIKASKANVRSGPGKNYRVKFTYHQRYLPIRVISKYDNWNEIEDFEGERGWISRNLLSKKRTVVIKTNKSFINVYSAATNKSRIIIKLENKVVAKLLGCKKEWCKIQVQGKKGWLTKEHFWGA